MLKSCCGVCVLWFIYVMVILELDSIMQCHNDVQYWKLRPVKHVRLQKIAVLCSDHRDILCLDICVYALIFFICFQSGRSFPEGEFRNHCAVQSESKIVSWSIRRVCLSFHLDVSHHSTVGCHDRIYCDFPIFIYFPILYPIYTNHLLFVIAVWIPCDHRSFLLSFLFPVPVQHVFLCAFILSDDLILV